MANLDDALREAAATIISALGRYIPTPEGAQKRLFQAMRYSTFAGGKRLRPFLVLAGADLFGVPRAHALPTAAAIEMVHTYSLVHDDLPAMDNDDLRRGQPTCHKKFDEATAILTGDSLLTLAFEAVAASSGHPDPAVRADLVHALAIAAGAEGMAGGQMIDLEAELERSGLAARMLLQVHDELVLECPERELDAATEIVRRCMEGAVTLSVPLAVDIGHGDSWLEAH